ncbi:hypothetical protein [Streptomyces sp. NPDC102360]|uniref:hypothetical protein n=1 Tax=Streptomyces sp. NPDC102360 TaxID=3366160 RepID=UPI0037F8ACBD
MRVPPAELLREAEARTAGYAMPAVLFPLALLSGPLATLLLLVMEGPGASVVTGGVLAGGRGCSSPRRGLPGTGGLRGRPSGMTASAGILLWPSCC